MSLRFDAKRLPKQPGPAGWNLLLPPPPDPSPLIGRESADVAIIGAGFAGLAAARRLLQIDSALKVAVLEAGRLAEGPNGRNSGFMIDLPHDLASESYSGGETKEDKDATGLNRRAIQFAKEAATEYRLSKEIFDPCGKVNAAATEAGDRLNLSYAEHLAHMNEPFRLLDANDMRDLTGTDYYRSGLYTPGTVMLQPAAYIRGLAAGLRGTVALYEQSPVTRIEELDGGWSLTTPEGKLDCAKVILANNGHAESFGFFKRRLMHVFTYASMTEPLPKGALKGEPRWGATPADPMGTTVRRVNGVGGDRIVVRSRFTYNPSMEASPQAVDAAGRLHDRKFAERFPMLKDIEMEYRWAGHLCLSWNGVPAHGEQERNLYAAVCQNGLGTAKGTLSGISAAELALGQESDITRAMLGYPGPSRLPPEPLAWIGANAVLRWKEFKAGRE